MSISRTFEIILEIIGSKWYAKSCNTTGITSDLPLRKDSCLLDDIEFLILNINYISVNVNKDRVYSITVWTIVLLTGS